MKHTRVSYSALPQRTGSEKWLSIRMQEMPRETRDSADQTLLEAGLRPLDGITRHKYVCTTSYDFIPLIGSVRAISESCKRSPERFSVHMPMPLQKSSNNVPHVLGIHPKHKDLVHQHGVIKFIQRDLTKMNAKTLNHTSVKKSRPKRDLMNGLSTRKVVPDIPDAVRRCTSKLNHNVQFATPQFALCSPIAFLLKIMLPADKEPRCQDCQNRTNGLHPSRCVKRLQDLSDLIPSGVHQKRMPEEQRCKREQPYRRPNCSNQTLHESLLLGERV
ncbi:hypothetical protein GmRootV15_36200 [Variovorax sp. V15]